MATTPRQGDVPGVRLRRTVRLPGVPPARVRAWLADERRLARWLAPEVRPARAPELELHSGEIVELWQVVETEPEHRWTGSLRRVGWRAETSIEIELRSTAGGSELTLEQSGFERLPLSECLTLWQASRQRWELALARLADELAETA